MRLAHLHYHAVRHDRETNWNLAKLNMTSISEEVRRVLQEVDLGAALDDEDLQQIVSSLSGSGSSSSSGFGARSGGSEWAGISSQSSAGARSEPRGTQGAETPSVRSLTFPDEDRSPARKETPSLRDLGLQPPVAAGSAVASAYGGGRQTAQSCVHTWIFCS